MSISVAVINDIHVSWCEFFFLYLDLNAPTLYSFMSHTASIYSFIILLLICVLNHLYLFIKPCLLIYLFDALSSVVLLPSPLGVPVGVLSYRSLVVQVRWTQWNGTQVPHTADARVYQAI